MAQAAVQTYGISVSSACAAFAINPTCYRYKAKLSEENERVADWLIRLTANQRNWGFGLCFFIPAQRQRIWLESQTRLSDISGVGVEFTHKTQKAAYQGKARATVSAQGNQRSLVDGFYA